MIKGESELTNGLEAQEILETQLEEFFLYMSANGLLNKLKTVGAWVDCFQEFCHASSQEEV